MAGKKLEPLEEFNADRAKIYQPIVYSLPLPIPNGLACPECGKELMDSDGMILTSNPPQRNIQCSDCDYRGYRIA